MEPADAHEPQELTQAVDAVRGAVAALESSFSANRRALAGTQRDMFGAPVPVLKTADARAQALAAVDRAIAGVESVLDGGQRAAGDRGHA